MVKILPPLHCESCKVLLARNQTFYKAPAELDTDCVWCYPCFRLMDSFQITVQVEKQRMIRDRNDARKEVEVEEEVEVVVEAEVDATLTDSDSDTSS